MASKKVVCPICKAKVFVHGHLQRLAQHADAKHHAENPRSATICAGSGAPLADLQAYQWEGRSER